MKKFRSFPIIALVLAVLFSAFTTNTKQLKHDDPLWYYTEASDTNHDNATKYVALSGQDGSCIGSGSVRCVIEAPVGNPGEPDLSSITSFRSYKP